MAKHTLVFLLLISGYASTAMPQDAPAQAASAKFESGPGPHNFDFDAASGAYEERFLQVPDGAFTVKGLLQFVTVRANPKWEPLAAVEITGPKGPFYIGLIAFVSPKAPDKIEFATRDERLRGLPDDSFGRIHITEQAIPFELHVDRSGILQASVLGKPGRAVSVRPFQITRVRLLGSTGHIRFSNIEVAASDR
jgi:hypothetical protein